MVAISAYGIANRCGLVNKIPICESEFGIGFMFSVRFYLI